MKKSSGPQKIGVLYSGGLDSAALVAHYLERGAEVWPVYVRATLPWERTEIERGTQFLENIEQARLHPLQVAHLDLESAYERNWSFTGHTPGAASRDEAVFLPLRNLVLTTKAMLILSNHDVLEMALATLKGNPFPDGKPSYFRLLEKVFTAGLRRRVRIHSPFRNKTKAGIIGSLKSYPLHLSFSCIAPVGDLHCGRCNKCAERKRAFAQAGVGDRTVYAGEAPVKRLRRSF